MILSTVRAFSVLLLAAVLAGSTVSPEAAESPSGPVRRLNGVLLKAMRGAGALGFEGRYKLLAPILTRVVTFPDMARIAAGRSWGRLSAEQRARLTDAFAQVSIATFASRFNGYSGERFQVVSERAALRGSVLVENQIVKPSGEIVPINYLLRKFGGKWRVVDIFLKAKYSELAIKRSEYGSILKRRGFEGLIRKLNEKFARMKADRGG